MFWFLCSSVISEVVQLTNENFTSFISNSSRPIFLKLWANWCPHCKEFQPVWEQLCEVSDFNDKVYIADIECEANRDSCKAFEGKNFPRLYWIDAHNESMATYTGSRTLDHFSLFIKKQLNFPMVMIDESELSSYTSTANITTVFSFAIPSDDEATLKIAQTVTKVFRSFESRFLLLEGEKRLTAYTGIDRYEVFEGEWTVEAITDFIIMRSVPYMAEADGYVMKHLMTMQLPTFMILTNVSVDSYSEETLNLVDEVSKSIIVTKTSCQTTPWFCRYVDVDLNMSSATFLIYDRSRKLFWVNREQDQSNPAVLEWVRQVRDGAIRAKGPGNGIMSSILGSYYDQKAQGNPTFLFFIGPMLIILSTSFMLYDMCRTPKRKSRPKTE